MYDLNDRILLAFWGVLYTLCAALGFIQEPNEALGVFLTAVSVGFFVPGFLLLLRGQKKTVLWVSAASLSLTVLALLANILSTGLDIASGDLLYAFLGLVSAPMFCSQHWLLSLFLWACLLVASLPPRKKR